MKISGSYRSVILITVVFILVFMSAGMLALSQYTLVSMKAAVLNAAFVALLSGILLYKTRLWTCITGSKGFVLNYLCHSVCTFVLGLSLFYICNYAFADDEDGKIMKTVVVEKYRKTRHKSRRVGRNRYVQGAPYKVCYMKVMFADGRVKELEVRRDKYTRLHKGDTVPLFVSNGLFGIPVVKYSKTGKYENASSYREQFATDGVK